MHTRQLRTWLQGLCRRQCVCGLTWPCIEVTIAADRRREESRQRTVVSGLCPLSSNVPLLPHLPGCLARVDTFDAQPVVRVSSAMVGQPAGSETASRI
jgi:hypothetical protein